MGEATLATGSFSAITKDLGFVTLSFGRANFTATAQSSDGGALAAASSGVEVDGADILIMRTINSYSIASKGSGTTMQSTSKTGYFAIDIDGVDLGVLLTKSMDLLAPPKSAPLSGSVATFDADLKVFAENTYVGLDTEVVTVDGMSMVSASTMMVG